MVRLNEGLLIWIFSQFYMKIDNVILPGTAVDCALAVNEIEKGYDYLWLYERAHNKGFLPGLHDADRVLTQKYLEEQLASLHMQREKERQINEYQDFFQKGAC